jgi:putative Holliday junction resolvase
MQNKPVPSRIVGLDYGLARIGMALSDEQKIIASPFKTIETAKRLEMTAQKIVEEIESVKKTYNCTVELLVIGLPLKLSGKHSMLSDEVEHLASVLKVLTDVPIKLWDERLTTSQAERSMDSLTRKKRSKIIDKSAASIILQSYLEGRRKGE